MFYPLNMCPWCQGNIPHTLSNVIFDTDSYDLFNLQNNCTSCTGNLFNPSASRTFMSSGTPASLDYGTGLDTTPLPTSDESVSGH